MTPLKINVKQQLIWQKFCWILEFVMADKIRGKNLT